MSQIFVPTTGGGGDGILLSATGQLTSAQIKALHASPVTALASPGPGKGIIIVGNSFSYIYGGTSPFIAPPFINVWLYYSTVQVIYVAITNDELVGTSNGIIYGTPPAPVATQSIDNLPVTFYNQNLPEISGNAAGDNVLNWQLLYYIMTL